MQHAGTDEEAERHQKMINARHEFILAYCREKGWPVPGDTVLPVAQILEIRKQPGWQNPLGEDEPQESTLLVEAGGSTVIPKDKR